MKQEVEEKRIEAQRAKEENALLRAQVGESDKSREIMIREMNNIKEIATIDFHVREGKQLSAFRLRGDRNSPDYRT